MFKQESTSAGKILFQCCCCLMVWSDPSYYGSWCSHNNRHYKQTFKLEQYQPNNVQTITRFLLPSSYPVFSVSWKQSVDNNALQFYTAQKQRLDNLSSIYLKVCPVQCPGWMFQLYPQDVIKTRLLAKWRWEMGRYVGLQYVNGWVGGVKMAPCLTLSHLYPYGHTLPC